MTETNRIEFKERLTDELDIEKEVVAFLNSNEGGYIYIGIDKTGHAVGVADLDGDMLKIKDRIKNNIQPSAMGLFEVRADKVDSLDVIKIIVAAGCDKPYFKKRFGMTEKGCFVRIGTAAESMPQNQIDKLFSQRTRNSIGKIKSYHQDLTFEQLRIFYEENVKPLGDNFKKTLELLTEDGSLNYVAYLLADENNVSIKVAKYSSLDRTALSENNEYGYCSLIKATKLVLDKIITVENKTMAKITPFERQEKNLWDKTALREAIINAMVHNNYAIEVPPKFEIFPDRIEITSAGTLPTDMSKKEFFEGISIPRNKELMRVFADLKMVESLGSGIPRILKTYGEDSFYFMDNFTRVIFPCTIDTEMIKSSEGLNEGLNEGLKSVLDFIQSSPLRRIPEIANVIGKSTQMTERYIKELKEKDLIEYVGSKKAGGYQCKK